MPALRIRVRFPIGQYNAQSATGPEWPPAPSRLASALLSAAHTLGTPEAIAAARSVFTWDAPQVDAPPAGQRTAVQRYVMNNTARLVGEKVFQPSLKIDPEGGQHLDADAPVTYWFLGVPAERVHALAEVAAAVPYLGRPTSPAIIAVDHVEEIPARPAGYNRWTPDPAGSERLPVATPSFLDRLDARFAATQQAGSTLKGLPLHRDYAKYQLTTDVIDTTATLAAWSVIAESVDAGALYRPTTRVQGADATLVVAGMVALTGATSALPVFYTDGDRADGRLLGVLATGAPAMPDDVQVATLTGMVTFTRQYADATHNIRVAIRRANGASALWSTVTPVADTPETLAEAYRRLTSVMAEHGATIADGMVHTNPRNPRLPAGDGLIHLSVLTNRPISGPVVMHLNGLPVHLEAADPTTGEPLR